MEGDKKVAVVTGGARGIGAATVSTFARNGYIVASLDIIQEEGEQVCRQVQEEHGDAYF